MKALLLLFALATSTITCQADNLLANSSFEEVGHEPDVASAWSRWGNWINRETAWTPTQSGECLIGYHHWEITSNENSGIWQNVFGVKAGQRVKFSVFACADSPDSDTSPADKIELRLETTRNGKQVAIESFTIAIADLQKDSKWHELTVTGILPNDDLRVLISVTPAAEGPRGGAVKFDDASLKTVVWPHKELDPLKK